MPNDPTTGWSNSAGQMLPGQLEKANGQPLLTRGKRHGLAAAGKEQEPQQKIDGKPLCPDNGVNSVCDL